MQSKSGGLHLFLFMDIFTDSKTVKSFLTNLLSLFGLKQDTEIFPKQNQMQTTKIDYQMVIILRRLHLTLL